MNKISIRRFVYIPIIVTLCFFTNLINTNLKKPVLSISKEESAYNFGPLSLKIASAGNERLLASILWIQTLLESDEEHFKKDDGNSWMFYRFNSISYLTPNFYENYLFGGKYLSIIKDDIYGAETIYEKGLRIYPEDYELIKDAAFNYYFEIKDYDKAITLYKKILNHPRIEKEFSLLPSIIAKAIHKRGSPEEAYSVLLNQYNTTKIEAIKKRLALRIYSIKAIIDLKCLNSRKKDCSSYDFFNYPYLKNKDGRFSSKYQFKYYN